MCHSESSSAGAKAVQHEKGGELWQKILLPVYVSHEEQAQKCARNQQEERGTTCVPFSSSDDDDERLEPLHLLFLSCAAQSATMQNVEGKLVDLYIPRKWCVHAGGRDRVSAGERRRE